MPRAARRATTSGQWLLWLILTAASLGGFAAIITLVSPFNWAHVPLTRHPWVLSLRMEWMPVAGFLALVSPLLALVALLSRLWRAATLCMIGVCAALQFAYVGVETYWTSQERASVFAQDDPWTKPGEGKR